MTALRSPFAPRLNANLDTGEDRPSGVYVIFCCNMIEYQEIARAVRRSQGQPRLRLSKCSEYNFDDLCSSSVAMKPLTPRQWGASSWALSSRRMGMFRRVQPVRGKSSECGQSASTKHSAGPGGVGEEPKHGHRAVWKIVEDQQIGISVFNLRRFSNSQFRSFRYLHHHSLELCRPLNCHLF